MSLLFQEAEVILLDTSLGLSADEKYFLIRMLCIYSYGSLKMDGYLDKTVNELEQHLGMSDYQIKKVRDGLLEKGYLIRPEQIEQLERYRGRPRVKFAFSSSVIRRIKTVNEHEIDDDHKPRIVCLLLWGLTPPKQKDLTPSNRILLAALYAYANACGAVYNLGVMQLAKLSGLKTKDSTENQLNKLTKLGFILDRVSGVSTKIIWKYSSTGAFFLNVLNDKLIRPDNSPCLLLMKNYGLFGYQGERMSSRMGRLSITKSIVSEDISVVDFSGVELFENSCKSFSYKEPAWDDNLSEDECEWMGDKKFVEGLRFVLGDFRKHWYFDQFIEYKINRYASLMLSQYWHHVQSEFSIIKNFMMILKEDILQTKFREKLFKNNPHAQEHLSVFEIYLYRIIFETALLTKGLIKKMLKDVEEKVLSQSHYEILLCPYNKISYVTQYGLVIRLNQKSNKIKAMTLEVKYLNGTRHPPERELKHYKNYSFILSDPWSLFGLNIHEH